MRDSKGRFLKGLIPHNKRDIDLDEVLELYRFGMTMREISAKYGYVDINSRIAKLIKSKGLSRSKGFQNGHKPLIDQLGEKNHNWNGGRTIDNGYVKFLHNGKYVKEHQLVWCIANDFPIIPKGCCVHHLNGIRDDNRSDNLTLLPISTHTALHNKFRKGEVI